MIGSKLKRVVAAIATALLIAGGAVTSISAPASAATVPNRYYCNPATGFCLQVNGAYVSGLPRVCHWKRSGMTNNWGMWYQNCSWFEADVP